MPLKHLKNLSFIVIVIMGMLMSYLSGPSRSPKYALDGVRLALTQMSCHLRLESVHISAPPLYPTGNFSLASSS